jgi:predicted GIY-YIG superfamily endonuclease
MFKVYFLLCSNNSFYSGHTNNLKQRYKQHCFGEVKSTINKRPLKLVYYENHETKEQAMKREKQLKGWSKIKKINLIKYGHPTKFIK